MATTRRQAARASELWWRHSTGRPLIERATPMAPCTMLLGWMVSLLGVVGMASKHPRPRFAVVLTLALNSTTSMPPRVIQGQLCRLRGVIASLRSVGYYGDIICQTAGLLAHGASTRAVLHSSCSHVLALSAPAYDAGPPTKDLNDTQSWYRDHGRMPPPDGMELQDRHDGALTSVKLHAWNLTRYSMVLHSDVDVAFLESPQRALEQAHESGVVFQAASMERAKRGYDGLNTQCAMLTRCLRDAYVMLPSPLEIGARSTRALRVPVLRLCPGLLSFVPYAFWASLIALFSLSHAVPDSPQEMTATRGQSAATG